MNRALDAFFRQGGCHTVHRIRGSGWERRARDRQNMLSQTPHPFRRSAGLCRCRAGSGNDVGSCDLGASRLSGAAALFLIHAVAPVVPRGDARRRHFQRICCTSEGSSLARRPCPPCVLAQRALYQSWMPWPSKHLRSAVVSPSMPYAGAAVSTVRPSLRAEAVDNTTALQAGHKAYWRDWRKVVSREALSGTDGLE
jgi:hypothetical protein